MECDNHLLPAVSIVVPVYNAASFVEECIQSLLSLDYPKDKLEIIFVDNDSNDRSMEILKKYSDKIMILSESRRGAGAARNNGVRESKYDIVAFIDADCIADKEWVKNLVAPFLNNEVAAVGGRILAKNPKNFIQKYGDFINDHDKAINYYDHPYIGAANMSIRKSVFFKGGMFDEEFLHGQDADLSFRLNQMGCRFQYMADAINFHSNEETLAGLFREGFTHGFWAIKLRKKHRRAVLKNTPRIKIKDHLGLITSPMKFILKSLSFDRTALFFLCDFVFKLGKIIGMVYGAIKFRYLSF